MNESPVVCDAGALIAKIRPLLESLSRQGYHLLPRLIEAACQQVDEGSLFRSLALHR